MTTNPKGNLCLLTANQKGHQELNAKILSLIVLISSYLCIGQQVVKAVNLNIVPFINRDIDLNYAPQNEDEAQLLQQIVNSMKNKNKAGIEYLALQFINQQPENIIRVRYITHRISWAFENPKTKIKWHKIVADHKFSDASDCLEVSELILDDDYFENYYTQYNEAVLYANKALEKSKNPSEKFESLSFLLLANLKGRDFESARKNFPRLHEYVKKLPPLTSDPEFIDYATYRYNTIFNEANDTGETYFKNAATNLGFNIISWQIRSQPSNAKYYVNRGEWYRFKKDYQLALKEYTQAIKIDPMYFDAYDKRIDVYRYLNSPQSAINDYSIKIRLKEQNPKLIQSDEYYKLSLGYDYVFRGYLYARVNQCQKALHDLMKACSLGVDSCDETCG